MTGLVLWAKVIDHRKCIGCHACSVACKAEHAVPIGVSRTRVMQVETGVHPSARRHFQVIRCNHCERAPCAAICPVRAMFRRPDGIVDFDRSACIGCKACLAACPYDAIYVDPESKSAAKCNFCAHRVEAGIEPACASVCPQRAIIVGDLSDPAGEVGRLMSAETLAVRKPEKGTRPKVFYVGLNGPAFEGEGRPAEAALGGERRRGEAPWDWRVSAYTWTKSLAAGLYLLPALFAALGRPGPAPWPLASSIAALGFLALTGLLLLADLSHPGRFLSLYIRPNPRSWLARGAFIIASYGAVLTADIASRLLGWEFITHWSWVPGVPLAVLAGVYTAFLFAQARGRDLWQNPALPVAMMVQTVLAGGAGAILIGAFTGNTPENAALITWIFFSGLALHLALSLGEVVIPHPSRNGSLAARQMAEGRWRGFYWGGLSLAAAGIAAAAAGYATAGAVLALGGLLLYEHAYIQAGQSGHA